MISATGLLPESEDLELTAEEGRLRPPGTFEKGHMMAFLAQYFDTSAGYQPSVTEGRSRGASRTRVPFGHAAI